MAAEMGAEFVFAERLVSEEGAVRYRIPAPMRGAVSDRHVLLVDDAVNAGSALRSTLADLSDRGAELAGLASLLALGDAPSARDYAPSARDYAPHRRDDALPARDGAASQIAGQH